VPDQELITRFAINTVRNPMDALDALLTRASPVRLSDPAPDDATLGRILLAGTRAPDHGRLRPWRFFVVRGEARQRLGEILAETLRAREPDVPDSVVAKERGKPLRAPLIVVIAAKLQEHRKIPRDEQIIAAGAAAQNILLAAHALGFGGMWRTGAPAYDALVKRAFGLDEHDSIIGFLYLGTPAAAAPPIERPQLAPYIIEWNGPIAP